MNGLVHHIELYCKDLETSKGFWSWLLSEMEYEIHQEWDAGISYKLEQTYIVLVQVADKHLDKEYQRCGAGLNHIAFHGSRDFVDDITLKAEQRGITILYKDRHPYAAGVDCYAVFLESPSRMKVEVAAY